MRPIAGHTQGFTLVELLIGMLITSIILSAVATFAFALSTASLVSGDTAAKQAQLRQATLRIHDLIGSCKLLCAAPDNDLAVWRADDNADGQINVNELVYVERGPDGTMLLGLCQFAVVDNPVVTLSDLALAATKTQLQAICHPTYVSLIPACQDVKFAFHPVPPPLTYVDCLMVSFQLTENGVNHRYEIVTALRMSGDWP
ncbi:MAG: prepilin-type N-terminal cleavage/methylation domain-containing protein, partial [Planctomycetes bacterium]|nr:prepilin-type N-terminal cleavage/methylation domain-containing protein [Planctomycetota bacterium]